MNGQSICLENLSIFSRYSVGEFFMQELTLSFDEDRGTFEVFRNVRNLQRH